MNLLFYILAPIVVLVGLLYCFVLVYKLDQRINKKKFDKLRKRGIKWVRKYGVERFHQCVDMD